MRCPGTLLAPCLTAQPAAAQQPGASSPARPLVRWPEALGFVALSGITFATDGSIRGTIQGHNSSFRNSAAALGNAFGNARYVYPVLLLGTLGGDLAGSSDLHEVSWRAFKSTALAGATTLVLKSLIGRRRPEVSPDDPYRFNPISFTFNSFPSGHTTTAFALATSLAMGRRAICPTSFCTVSPPRPPSPACTSTSTGRPTRSSGRPSESWPPGSSIGATRRPGPAPQ